MGGVPWDASTIDRGLCDCHSGAVSPLGPPLRQFECELASGPGTALHQDPAAVGAGHCLDQVEADPHADQVAVGVGLDPSKPLEQLPLVVGLDPKAVIAD